MPSQEHERSLASIKLQCGEFFALMSTVKEAEYALAKLLEFVLSNEAQARGLSRFLSGSGLPAERQAEPDADTQIFLDAIAPSAEMERFAYGVRSILEGRPSVAIEGGEFVMAVIEARRQHEKKSVPAESESLVRGIREAVASTPVSSAKERETAIVFSTDRVVPEKPVERDETVAFETEKAGTGLIAIVGEPDEYFGLDPRSELPHPSKVFAVPGQRPIIVDAEVLDVSMERLFEMLADYVDSMSYPAINVADDSSLICEEGMSIIRLSEEEEELKAALEDPGIFERITQALPAVPPYKIIWMAVNGVAIKLALCTEERRVVYLKD